MRKGRRLLFTLLTVASCKACSRRAPSEAGTSSQASGVASAAPAGDAEVSEANSCSAEPAGGAQRGALSQIAGALVIEARDGRSPSHGLWNLSTARFHLGNLTTRPLRVGVKSLYWSTLAARSRPEPFPIESVTVGSGGTVSGTTITLEPGRCAAIAVVAGGVPKVGYHVRAAYAATFTTDGASVVARGNDMYFRAPLPPR